MRNWRYGHCRWDRHYRGIKRGHSEAGLRVRCYAKQLLDRHGRRDPQETTLQPILIDIGDRNISAKLIDIHTILFTDRIPAHPPPHARVVIPIPVIDQIRLIILILGREPERICLGHGAC